MKKMILLTMVLLAIVSGQVWAENRQVSINFAENTNQVFAGGQLIGPFATDSTNWNNSGANIASGSMAGLIDSEGDKTGINVSWTSANCWWQGDGTADDEHRISVGYLDDGGAGVLVTLDNIPYDTYQIVGLYSSGQGDTATINFDINGALAFGTNATDIADAYGSINSCNAATGSFWAQIDPNGLGAKGNYWVADAIGRTCTINGEARNGTSRGSLAALIIISDSDLQVPSELLPRVQRSHSVNLTNMGSGWQYHDQISWSSVPSHIAGYSDPNDALYYQQASGWNDMRWDDTPKGSPFKITDQLGGDDGAIFIHNADFSWNTNTGGDNINNSLPDASDEYKNLGRLTARFFGHYPGSHPAEGDLLASVKKVPYGKYDVIAYLNVNGAHQNALTIEDTTYYYVGEPSVDFKARLLADPNNPQWLMATDTVGPPSQVANLAIFKDCTAENLEIMIDAGSNSGIDAFQIIATTEADDVVTQTSPGNVDKNYGGIPVSVTSVLSWDAPVNGADSYDVYIGVYGDEDPNIYLVEADNTTGSYAPTLDYGLTYIWRVDTVIGGEVISGDNFYFDVEGDPVIQIQPRDVSVKAGYNTFFTIDAVLTENYEWFYSADAAVDTPDDDVPVQSGPDATLNVTDVTEGVNTGYYYVILTNTIEGSNAIVSEVASLEIGKLEVHLPFDGDPNDVSGNGWDAVYGNREPNPIDPNYTVPSMGEVSYQPGYDGIGQAVKFTRGSGDQLEILGSDEYFNFYPKGFTIRMWVKPDDYANAGGFMTYVGKGGNNWRMLDTANFYGQGFEAKMYPLGRNTAAGMIDDGNWHMVACTYDGATQEMKVYQEGFLDATITGALNTPDSYPITIGSYYKTGTGGWGYNGLIDDVEIFSYAISEREMLEDYATKTGEVFCIGGEIAGDVDGDCKVGLSDLEISAGQWLDSLSPNVQSASQQSAQVVSWQLDETSGFVAADSSGNGVDGTLGTGFTTGQWIVDGGRTNRVGDNALYVDGSVNMDVTAVIADPNATLGEAKNIFQGTDSWTVGVWVKLTSADMAIIGGFGDCEWDEGTEAQTDRYLAAFGDYAGYEFETGNNGLWPSQGLADDTWKMLTVTYDGTTQLAVAYLNGAEVAQTTVALADTEEAAFKLNNAGAIIWGNYRNYLVGLIDDFNVWNVALTAEEVAEMYEPCEGSFDGDLNGDCSVDLLDYATMAGDWLKCNIIPSTLCD